MRQNWDSNEIKLLKRYYSNTPKYKLLKIFRNKDSGRSWSSIYQRANKLGLRKITYKSHIDEILKKHYSNKPLKDVLQMTRVYLPYVNKKALIMRANRLGLTRRSFAAEQQLKKVIIPKPSKELAWFLGVLAGDGYVASLNDKSKSYKVQLTVTSPEFIKEFNKTGKRLFGIKASLRKYNKYKLKGKWRKYYDCVFLSKKLVEFFGNWKENAWPITLKTKFRWVLENKKFLQYFLAGYFDSDGSAMHNPLRYKRRVTFAVMNKDAQKLIKEILQEIGVKGKIYWKGVQVDGKVNVKKFAEQIKSCIPHKQRILNLFKRI